MAMKSIEDLLSAIKVVKEFSDDARKTYLHSKEWTTTENTGCMTIRVPVALLNRIDDMAKEVEELRTED